MTIPADKIIITITAAGYEIAAYAGGTAIAEQSNERGMDCFSRAGDTLTDCLPTDLAVSLELMDINLTDAAQAMWEAA